ncbi:MAG: hypothetical protein Q9162_001033 [Coniocarpon cinnabarinum]
MAEPTPREAALTRLNATLKSNNPIIGAGAGIGLSAKSIAAGSADMLILYNSGRYRMAGRGSLAGLMPYGNANDVVVDMSSEILPLIHSMKSPPLMLAGVCASDPFRDIERFLHELKERGFDGVQNFPTVGLIDGSFRANLEETGMGYDCEIELVRQARKLGLLTTPYVFNPSEARSMTEAGADVLVAHMGLTTSGTIGAKTGKSLEQCVGDVDEIVEAARNVRREVLVLCHGGPIARPEDARFILERCAVDGFYGASSMERLPAESAIEGVTREFKGIKLGRWGCG